MGQECGQSLEASVDGRWLVQNGAIVGYDWNAAREELVAALPGMRGSGAVALLVLVQTPLYRGAKTWLTTRAARTGKRG